MLEAMGIDLSDIQWQDLSLCKGTHPNMFFDDYESNDQLAQAVDQMCLSCPVMKLCLQRGVEGSEYGVWGGIYLTSGKPDNNRNEHKTQEVWDALRERLSD